MRDLLGVVDAATRALGSLRIRYVIVGGVAVNVLGRARSTLDVDIIAEFRVGSAARLESAFRKQGFRIREEEIVDALRERSHFTVFDTRSEYHLDCKGTYSKHERRALRERRRMKAGRRFLYFDSPENLILMKLAFGSDQDYLDAVAVFVRQRPRIDLARLASRAIEMGLAQSWRSFRERVERMEEETESE